MNKNYQRIILILVFVIITYFLILFFGPNCKSYVSDFSRKEFNLVVQEFYVENHSLVINGYDFKYNKRTNYNELLFDGLDERQIVIGDTLVKPKGSTSVLIKKKNKVLIFNFNCN